jgi:hypothetical protein
MLVTLRTVGKICDLERGILIGWGIGEVIGYVMCMIWMVIIHKWRDGGERESM